MPITIRRLGPGDAAVLAAIAADAPLFELDGSGEPDPPLTDAAADAYLAEPAVLHWVAEEDELVLGELLCHLLPMPWAPGSEVLLYAIGVRSGHRRRGIGRALIDELRHWMRDAGVPTVWVLADNPGAEAFYEGCGFRRGGAGEQGVLYVIEDES